VTQPHGDSKSDLWIFNEAAKHFKQGKKINFPAKPADVFNEMRELSKGRLVDISGMDHDLIEEKRGIQWPYTQDEVDQGKAPAQGGKRLYTEDATFRFADGKAKLIPLPYIENNEVPDDHFPFWLNTGRVVEHFHTRTKTGKLGNNNKYSPIPYMEINPDAAAEMAVMNGEYIRCVSRRGDAVVMAQLTHRVPRNMVFIPFHYHDCVNRLTLGLLDPHSRQPAFKQSAVKIEKVADQKAAAQMNLEMRAF
jgi:predicted molibdopterin-dependent oxidoreductase YjgC